MNGTNYEVPRCRAYVTPHSHPSWAQIFASGPCFQIPLAHIPPLAQLNCLRWHRGPKFKRLMSGEHEGHSAYPY